MYATCLFCHGALGRNEAIECFPVGTRLAFDAAHGRLWVVCTGCGRWNLTPLDDRWEAIEACERRYRDTRVRVSTPNIGLARLAEGVELIRIGAPLRPEFAAWRYGTRFLGRRRETQLVAAAGAALTLATAAIAGPVLAPALTLGAISIVAIPGLTSALGVIPVVGTLAIRDYLVHDRVVARLSGPRGRVLTVRAKHLSDVELHVDHRGGLPTLEVMHDGGWVRYSGSAAIQTTALLLAGANRFGASGAQVQAAVGHIEQSGDASSYLARTATMGRSRVRIMSMLNEYRRLGAMHLNPVERLALEMAVHEESERRAMEGELAILEAAWRDAERIAAIADTLLLDDEAGGGRHRLLPPA
jgi:hypothetical protein